MNFKILAKTFITIVSKPFLNKIIKQIKKKNYKFCSKYTEGD